MRLSYPYTDDGFTMHGEKIPDIPIVYLRLKVGRFRASGPAIVDMGFDGGVYPNMEIIKMFRGWSLKPGLSLKIPVRRLRF